MSTCWVCKALTLYNEVQFLHLLSRPSRCNKHQYHVRPGQRSWKWASEPLKGEFISVLESVQDWITQQKKKEFHFQWQNISFFFRNTYSSHKQPAMEPWIAIGVIALSKGECQKLFCARKQMKDTQREVFSLFSLKNAADNSNGP